MVQILSNDDKSQETSIFSHCVCNGAGWRELHTQEEFSLLKQVKNESRGPKHVPLQHWDGVRMFQDRMAAANVAVKNQVGMLSPNERKFIYLAEATDLELPDLNFMLGFISFNDKSRSVQAILGSHVFVCSNLTFNGVSEELRQKHLSHVVDGTAQIFDAGIAKFNEYRDRQLSRISRMKEVEVSREMQGSLVLDLMHSPVFGKDPMLVSAINSQFEKPVHDEFLDRSAWHFHNAATEELKKVSYSSRIKTDEELDRILTPYIA